jgi:Cof subfamily protein (haloacid dehalogenase superfamily)
MVRMQLVASDLDGTIVARDGTISERTLTALQQCEKAGVHVVFVTGRPPRWMAPIVEATGHRGLALCGNGAVVVDLATSEVVRSSALPADVVRSVTATLRELLPGASFALETLDGYRREPDFLPRHATAWEVPIGTLDELLTAEPVVIKMLCRQAGEHARSLSADEMLAIARQALAGVVEVVHSDPRGHLLEMSAPGVTKATALAWLAERLGVPREEVVAFGDMPNDVPMLLWAGAGYAMSDGHPEALAAAPNTAPPLHEDGVAQVLERLLGQN